MNTARKVLQIIPAEGWSAVYAERNEDGTPRATAVPLVCWALVEVPASFGRPASSTNVEGMDVDTRVDFCEDTTNFIGYLSPGQAPNSKLEEVREHLETEERSDRESQKLRDAGYMAGNQGGIPPWKSPGGQVMSKTEALRELEGI